MVPDHVARLAVRGQRILPYSPELIARGPPTVGSPNRLAFRWLPFWTSAPGDHQEAVTTVTNLGSGSGLLGEGMPLSESVPVPLYGLGV